jgi:hypothetical protein
MILPTLADDVKSLRFEPVGCRMAAKGRAIDLIRRSKQIPRLKQNFKPVRLPQVDAADRIVSLRGTHRALPCPSIWISYQGYGIEGE